MEDNNMCRKLVVVNKLGLGTRELGYEVLSLPKGEVLEFTSKQLRDLIKSGRDEVYGLKIAENGIDLEFDKAFHTNNMMYKVHIASLTPLVEDECMVNLFYIVIGTHKEKDNIMYEVVSSRFIQTLANIIDDRIHKRLSQEDIIKVYNAEITNYSTTTNSVSYNVTEGTSDTAIKHTTTIEVVSSITVKYDKDFEVTISNTSVQQIPIDYLSSTRKKWVKICTYDGVQFYVLHTL